MARIVVDARNITDQPGGVARYAEALLSRLSRMATAHDITVVRHTSSRAPLDAPGIREIYTAAPNDGLPHHLWGAFTLARHLSPKGETPDLYHSLFHILPRGMGAVFGQTRIVVTLHDLVWIDHAEESQPTAAKAHAMRAFGALAIPHALERADHVIAVSEPTARRAAPWLYDTPTTVIPHGVDAAFFRAERETSVGAPRRIVAIGNAKPYKNLVLLVRAFARSLPVLDSAELVLIGDVEGLRPTVRELGLPPERVRLAGRLGDRALRDAVAEASAFVFPSHVEGFGLPILEAMASGVPSIVADVEPMRSIAGGAALTFDPHSERELAERLTQLLRDPELAEDLRRRGRARAQAFRWEDTARATLAVYERVLSGRAR